MADRFRLSLATLATLATVAAAGACGCAVPHRPAALPPSDEPYVAVLSGEMPEPITGVARHAWVVASDPPRARLRRYELVGSAGAGETSEPFEYFGNGEVAVHGVVRMDAARLAAARACFEDETRRYGEEHPDYFPIPGPNSNTFVDVLLRRCGVHVELPVTAIGRDYRGPVGASVTSVGTGVQLESWVLGVKLGLEEGIELHVVGMGLGVHLWPPALTVPVNPGRIGFDDSTHVEPSDDAYARLVRERERELDSPEDRDFGLGDAWMFARYARVGDPARAAGLEDRATVGLSGRALYGRRLGYAFGADLELGAANPAGFAYDVALYPVGAGIAIGPTGLFSLLGGAGISGATGSVPFGFGFPAEARLELDAGRLARIGVRAGLAWLPFTDARQGGSRLLPFADELVLGVFTRIGRTVHWGGGNMAHGWFFGFERRELMKTFWLGVTLGVEIDAGG